MAGQLESEVRKILGNAQGNKALAQRELITAVLRDDELLRELAAPYLKAMTMQAIERASGVSSIRASGAGQTRSEAGTASAPLSAGGRAVIKDLQAGYNPMRAASGSDPALGARPEASGRHISTLKLLAKVYEIRRGGQKV